MSSRSGGTKHQWDAADAEKPQRAIVVVPQFASKAMATSFSEDGSDGATSGSQHLTRTLEARIEEACGLARAINLEICDALGIQIRSVRPSTLVGKGKLIELVNLVKAHEADLVIVDHSISPVQQQNLEKKLNCKVLDRTALILEIFGARAQTREGRVQVELAHLNYQKGRLVRTWTHLERQRGALGFVGGPGETQIEADRRMIRERISRLESQLEKIKKTRDLHRTKRKKVPHPVVALVGYTNAGKSTLFNTLTGAKVFAKDLLFATLDPTLRQLELPGGTEVILSDTVGFVSNLPTHLIAAFRATLEEVIEADLILHVRDISDPDHEIQAREVYTIMSQLGIGENGHEKVVEVWNKIDQISADQFEQLKNVRSSEDAPLLVSAIRGDGLEILLERVEDTIATRTEVRKIIVPVAMLGKLPWFYENTKVVSSEACEDGAIELTIRAGKEAFDKVATMGLS